MVSTQRDGNTFEKGALFSLQLATGVTVFVGRLLVEEKQKSIETNEKPLTLESESGTVISSSTEKSGSLQPMAAKTKTEKTKTVTPGASVEQEAQTTEETKAAPEETTEQTAKEVVTAEAPKTEEKPVEKGKVAEMLAEMSKEKYNRLQEVFKLISAFDEAAWAAPNEAADLQGLVTELSDMLGGVTVKAADESQNVVTGVAQVVSNTVMEKLQGALAGLSALPEILSNLPDQICERMKAMQTEPETKTEPEVETKQPEIEVKTKPDNPENTLNALEKGLSELIGQFKEIQKTAVAPAQDHENPPTKADESDPNAIFGGSTWPFPQARR